MQKERVILYADLNNFFASVETRLHPEFEGKPLIVCGDPKKRRGVVLAKNEEAKKYGIKTGVTVYTALKKCPHLLQTGTHFYEYQKYSQKVKEIYLRFTDMVEECSIDECALDVTASQRLFGSGEEIAEKIRRAVKEEIGVTVSVGVSFNKIYAKLASEFKKPDAVSVVTKENYQRTVYPRPVTELLFVGRSTAKKLHAYGITTIGALATAEENLLINLLGKRGWQLRRFAAGLDDEPVNPKPVKEDMKSIGNSLTLPVSVTSREEVKRWLYVLAESVTARQRDADVGRANTVHLVVRNDELDWFSYQKKVRATTLCGEVANAAYELFCEHYPIGSPVRLLGVSVSSFDYNVRQVTLDSLTGQDDGYEKKNRVESAVAGLRKKYGYAALQRGVVMEDENSSGLDIRKKQQPAVKEEQVIRDK
ncbi:MAG: DNA polymerase IV [Clostridia bacterium]|nr:DNA polymerase IV [Clostridia bacterium]